jgi:hypothetical protein
MRHLEEKGLCGTYTFSLLAGWVDLLLQRVASFSGFSSSGVRCGIFGGYCT